MQMLLLCWDVLFSNQLLKTEKKNCFTSPTFKRNPSKNQNKLLHFSDTLWVEEEQMLPSSYVSDCLWCLAWQKSQQSQAEEAVCVFSDAFVESGTNSVKYNSLFGYNLVQTESEKDCENSGNSLIHRYHRLKTYCYFWITNICQKNVFLLWIAHSWIVD